MNPKKWWDLQNGGKLTDTRETINGFPCRLILVNDGTNTLQEGQEEPTPGNTKDMGVFNFNNDKSNTKTLGFDTDNFPFCASFEVASNSDTSAGAFMSYNVYKINYFYESAENRYTTVFMDISYLGVDKITFSDDNILFVAIKTQNDTKFYNNDGNTYNVPDGALYFKITIKENKPFKFGDKNYILEGKSNNPNEIKIPIYDNDGELAYIKDSFELRFPDEDDVGADYGFLDMNGDSTRGLKRVIDFVDKSSDEDFIAHFEEYFNKQYTFRYFLLVMGLG